VAPIQPVPPAVATIETFSPAKTADHAEKVAAPVEAPKAKPVDKAQHQTAPSPAVTSSHTEAHDTHEHHDQRERAFTENDDDHSPQPVTLTDAQSDREAQVGIEIVQKLIGYLGITATVTARRAEAVDGKDTRHWVLEISGQELALLIGSKGETLGALQYLTRLIAARTLGHRVNLVVDVAGYKSHREDMLRRLARRMASQVVDTNRSVSLEPMPPHERRIIHMTLRDHPSVKTESVGEGDKRKVTIVPRRNKD
jgi:spoIIIJ-associated protein